MFRAFAIAVAFLANLLLAPPLVAYAAAGDGPGDFTLFTWTTFGTNAVSDTVNIRRAQSVTVEVNITAVAGTTPTLDLYIQHSVDGTLWDDIAHFTQITAATRRQVNISTIVAGALTDHAAADATMAVNTVRQGPIGGFLRGKAVFTGTGPQYTGTVKLHADGV